MIWHFKDRKFQKLEPLTSDSNTRRQKLLETYMLVSGSNQWQHFVGVCYQNLEFP